MEQPFSYNIYQQGKKLYENMKVTNVTVSGNSVEGNVMEHKLHKVKLVFTAKKLTAKYCDCTYSKVYRECQHSAALYIRYMNEGRTAVQDQTFRNVYNAYISNKFKPKSSDYINFENVLLRRMKNMAEQGSFEAIRDCCEELHRVTYPQQRIHHLIPKMIDVIDMITKDENLHKKVYDWGIASLSTNKNNHFHGYFINLIQQKDSQEIVNCCEELLKQMPVVLNAKSSSKLLILLKNHSTMSFEEFENKYETFENTEVMVYLKAQDLMSKQEYQKAKEEIENFQRIRRGGILQNEIRELYEKAWILCDPKSYLEHLCDRISYWNPDFSELLNAKKLLGEKWCDLRYDAYDIIHHKIDFYFFINLIKIENEWEYAVYLLHKEPSMDYLNNFAGLIEKNAPEIFAEVVLEVTLSLTSQTNSVKTYHAVADYLKTMLIRSYDPESVEYILYYLKKLNSNKKKLIELLDDVMEDGYEA